MKPFPQALFVAAAAGLCGLVLGYASSSKGISKLGGTSGGAAGPGLVKARVSSGSGNRLIFASLPPRQFFDRALAIVLHGEKSESMATLQELLVNKSLPPVAAGIYRNALVARLVHLGAAKALLERGQFSTADRQAIVAEVVRSLAETDPDAALAVLKNLSVTERPGAISALLEQLGRSDPKRGLALIEADPSLRDGGSSFYFGWAKADPRAAAERVFAGDDGMRDRTMQMNVLAAWAGDDPEAAWKWIASMPGSGRASAQNIWLSVLAMTEPDVALAALETKPELNNIFNSIRGQWVGLSVANNVAEANAAIDKVPPGTMRTQLIDGLSRSLSGQPTEAIAWLKTLLPGEQDQALDGLFMSLGLSDPAKALDIASRQLEGAQRHRAIGSVISGWALKDFDTAFQTMLQKLDPEDLPSALSTIFRYHSSAGDAEEAMQFAAIEKLDPARRGEVLRAKGEASSFRADEKLIDHVAQLPPADRAAFAEGAMGRSFEMSDAVAARLIAMLPGEKQAEFARDIGQIMERTDPAGAAAFLGQLPDGDQAASKRRALESVIRDWVDLEPAAAAAFTARLPAGETKDGATRALALELRNFDLAAATRAAGAAATQKIRNELIERLAGDWAQVDAERGRAAMAPLLRSDEDRKHATALLYQE